MIDEEQGEVLDTSKDETMRMRMSKLQRHCDRIVSVFDYGGTRALIMFGPVLIAVIIAVAIADAIGGDEWARFIGGVAFVVVALGVLIIGCLARFLPEEDAREHALNMSHNAPRRGWWRRVLRP